MFVSGKSVLPRRELCCPRRPSMIDRRKFLAATATAAAARAAEPDAKLAIDGGTPVRTQPLAGRNWGPQFYDEAERGHLNEVLDGRNPFRWNNPPAKSKVATFERE